MGIASWALGDDNPFSKYVADNRQTLQGAFAGFGQGPSFSAGLGNAAIGAQRGSMLDDITRKDREAEAKFTAEGNMTSEWVAANYPEFSGLPPAQAWQAAMAAENAKRKGGAAGGENFFGTGVPIKNADGTISYGQFGNQGGFNIPELPEGSEFLTPVQQLNVGTGFTGVDRFGNPTGQITPIDNFTPAQDAELGKVIGGAAAERILALPQTIATSENMVTSIDGILNDPALDSSTGWLSWMQAVPGTEQYSFGQRALQLQGQAFLQAFGSLKGGGTITEIEGLKAEQAIGRLSTAQNPADYRQALNELKGIIATAKTRAVNSAGAVQLPPGAAIGGNQPSASGRVLVYNPATGRLE